MFCKRYIILLLWRALKLMKKELSNSLSLHYCRRTLFIHSSRIQLLGGMQQNCFRRDDDRICGAFQGL